ncbi:hypothetical protein [Methanococcoides sp. FTZ1]|uniref:hypothetical protein n=1 Tax=Methanococcoides sp. FTZ1 TaxID=3439061 RepID=UPI003F85BC43
MLKAKGLSHNLVGTSKAVESMKPVYVAERNDTDLLRKKRSLTCLSPNGRRWGFSKGTLHYMKQNARSDKQFTLNAHVKERLENWGECC